MRKEYDLRNDSVSKLFTRYAFLSVVGLGAMSINTVLDGVFVGRGVGSMGIASINLVLSIYPLLIGIGMCFGAGAAALIAIHYGQGDEQGANEIFNVAALGAAVTAVVVSLLIIVLAEPIVIALGGTELLLRGSVTYLRTFTCFGPFFVLVLFFEPVVRNDGDPRRVMKSLLLGAGSNAVLNYIFIILWGWGLFGAAFATGIGQLLSFFYLAVHFLKKSGKLSVARYHFHGGKLLNIVRTGAPNFTTQFCQAVFIIVYNRVILSYMGENGVAINGIIQYLYEIIMLCNIGFGEAVQPIASYSLGAELYGRMRQVYYTAVKSGALFAALILGLFFLIPEVFIGAFTTEKALIAQAVPAVQIYYSALIIASFNMATIYYLQAVRKSEPATALTFMRNLGCFLITISILPKLLGNNGLWLAFPAAELLTMCLSLGVIWRQKFYFRCT